MSHAAARNAFIQHVPPLLLYLALTLVFTYPLSLHPATRIQSLGDPALNAYILWWNSEAIFHQITGYFHATMFWPNEYALAYGEHLLVPALMSLPAKLFGDGVLMHNFSVMQAYFLCASAAHALAFHYFRRVDAATIAGLAYGFAPYRFAQIGHVQLIHGEFLPLMNLAFEKTWQSGERRWKWALLGASLGQWLTSWYWAVFTLGCAAPLMAARVWISRRELNMPRLIGVLLPLVIAAALAFPMALPYMKLKSDHALFRPPDVAWVAADPGDFIAPSARNLLYGWLLLAPAIGMRHVNSEKALFLGVLPILGVLIAVCFAFRRKCADIHDSTADSFPAKTHLVLMLILLGFCFGVSWGSLSWPTPYGLIVRAIPLFADVRATARWILPALLCLSLVLAFAYSRFIKAWPQRRQRWIYLFFVVGLLLESAPASLNEFVRVPSLPEAAYEFLERQPFPSPILELPHMPDHVNTYLLGGMRHRQPFMNGSNGFFPPNYRSRIQMAGKFPSADAIDSLKSAEMGVRFVLVNPKANIHRDLQAMIEQAAHSYPPNTHNSDPPVIEIQVGQVTLKARRFEAHWLFELPPSNPLPS